MIGNDYHRSEYDNCVYHKELFDGSVIYLLLYVDDMFNCLQEFVWDQQVENSTSSRVWNEDLGATKKMLGMEIHRDREVGKLYLSNK